MNRVASALLGALAAVAYAQDTSEIVEGAPIGNHLTRFGAGDGPTLESGTLRMLDARGSNNQSNAYALDPAQRGASERTRFACKLRVLKGGDGGAVVFLNTGEYGAFGPAPFVKSWVEPNLARTFAVGIDVHNPKDEQMFSAWGNYRGNPQREISLHWDGREIVKRVAPREFRGGWADFEIVLEHVIGGAEVTVTIAGAKVYERYFIAGLLPYESRLAIGAGTRAKVATEFDVKDWMYAQTGVAAPVRAPKHFEVFNHVLTNNKQTTYEAEVRLPPANWEFGRVILTLDIHDAGPNWDEWDRNGEISIITAEGKRLGIVPFITSYRTECHWEVDVTHFRPWLAGKTKFEVRAGTTFYKNRGYMMSVGIDFYPGRLKLEPYRVVPVWHGTAKYKTAENHFRDFFQPQEIDIGAETLRARLFTTTTGHSQIGEFTPSRRTVIAQAHKDAPARRFENTLWKDDVYLNPNRPQFGTWKFSRAGWAPGDIVRPWWIDLSGVLLPGKTALLRYEPTTYDFSSAPKPPPQTKINQASHVVRSYLILYRAPKGTMPAPTLEITTVAAKSNAQNAGIKRGDYLAEYDGKVVRSLDELRAAIGAAANKQEISAVVYRGAERVEVTLAPGRMGVNLAAR